MKILLDLQILQVNAWDDKLTQYCYKLARTLIENRGQHDVIISLSHVFADKIDLIRRAFSDLIEKDKIHVWQGLHHGSMIGPENDSRTALSLLTYDNYIRGLGADALITSSIWQGWKEGVVTSSHLPHHASAVLAYPHQLRDCPEFAFTRKTQLQQFDIVCLTDDIGNLNTPQENVIKLPLTDDTNTVKNTADQIIEALARVHKIKTEAPFDFEGRKKRLAYVSPLPPEKSGIADYSAGILKALGKYYDIDLITRLDVIDSKDLVELFDTKTIKQFYDCADSYDHIMYHFGNSHFHEHMISMIAKFPGVVVAHDIFFSDLLHHLEHGHPNDSYYKNIFRTGLYESHGYPALKELSVKGRDEAINHFPTNNTYLRFAKGIIVHSDHAKQMVSQWNCPELLEDISLVKLPRREANDVSRAEARKTLGIPEDAFIFASFGSLSYAKQADQILKAWLSSSLSNNKDCYLYFVGQSSDSFFVHEIKRLIDTRSDARRMIVTGFVDAEMYEQYLSAADVGIQLRRRSRGESSISILDCFSHKLPTIINACGSFEEIPDETVFKLPADFKKKELVSAMETLHKDAKLRKRLQTTGYEYYIENHTPEIVARQYAGALERYKNKPLLITNANVCRMIERDPELNLSDQEILDLARVLTENSPKHLFKQFFVDISVIVNGDSRTGIQRVTRSVLDQLLTRELPGYRVEPVYRKNGQYYYAREYTLGILNIENFGLIDEPLDVGVGDIFLGLDLDPWNATDESAQKFLRHHSQRGLKIYYVVYDLLCITNPEWFLDGGFSLISEWISKASVNADELICISKATENHVKHWLQENLPDRLPMLKTSYFHLGADIESSKPTTGISPEDEKRLKQLRGQKTILSVGTLEPRKGYDQALDAMETLWSKGENIPYVIVGKKGWMMEKFISRVKRHGEYDKRLFWFEHASDELLHKIFKLAKVYLMASRGEGFGLPLIEAAREGLPIIVRDIPVFREIAGEHAHYFSGEKGADLANAIIQWLALNEKNNHPKSEAIPHLTWKESTDRLLSCIFESNAEVSHTQSKKKLAKAS